MNITQRIQKKFLELFGDEIEEQIITPYIPLKSHSGTPIITHNDIRDPAKIYPSTLFSYERVEFLNLNSPPPVDKE